MERMTIKKLTSLPKGPEDRLPRPAKNVQHLAGSWCYIGNLCVVTLFPARPECLLRNRHRAIKRKFRGRFRDPSLVIRTVKFTKGTLKLSNGEKSMTTVQMKMRFIYMATHLWSLCMWWLLKNKVMTATLIFYANIHISCKPKQNSLHKLLFSLAKETSTC